MQPDFWHQRWASNQIGFHESQANPLLIAHFDALQLPRAARVFVPLCGKTLDMDWLLARGHRVVGVELSPLAVAQLFERFDGPSTSRRVGALECRSSGNLEVFIGDILELSAGALGPVDAVYDRAAMIALPPGMRPRYARHVQALTAGAPQLLVTLEYDQSLVDGPPFSVPSAEVRRLYSSRSPVLLSQHDVPGGLKGKCPAAEVVWKI
jgi:thiopurine S-methyltransferase